ncbi:unnamed protein product [Lampetra fluviatilis]
MSSRRARFVNKPKRVLQIAETARAKPFGQSDSAGLSLRYPASSDGVQRSIDSSSRPQRPSPATGLWKSLAAKGKMSQTLAPGARHSHVRR